MNLITYVLLLVNLFKQNVLEYNKSEYITTNDLEIFITLYNYTSLFKKITQNANYIFQYEGEHFYDLYDFHNFPCYINNYTSFFCNDYDKNIFLELTQCGKDNLSCCIVTELNNGTLSFI